MASAPTKQKVAQQDSAPKTPPSAGPGGIALAPPSYGIDFSDGAIQRMGKLEEEEKKPLQRKALEEEEKPPVQAKGLLQREAAPSAAAEARPQNRTGLPDALKSGVEALSGLSLDDVRVHTNSPKPAGLQALAYTRGTDIHVAPGQERHLPHEAWHVVQQAQGRVKPVFQMKFVGVNDEMDLEREVDAKRIGLSQMSQLHFRSWQPTVPTQRQSSTQSIQRKINYDLKTVPDKAIQLLTNTYNELSEETSLTDRITTLGVLERKLYQWFITNKAPDLNLVPDAKFMQGLLNAIKVERQRIVEKSISEDQDHLNSEAALPIAGFNLLDTNIQKEIRIMWKNLVTGAGNIKITEVEDQEKDNETTHEKFKIKVLTEFSRLLESNYGRQMIRDINTSEYKIEIEPFLISNPRGKSFAASPTGEHESGSLKKLNEAPDINQRKHYPTLDLTNMDQKTRLTAINNLKRTQQNQLGIRLVDGISETYYKFGVGSAVKVTMPSDLDDSSQYTPSRLADTKDNELVTPVFITLGHELGHAIHMQRGAVTNNANSISKSIDPNDDLEPYLGDAEEYVNILGNENALRSEYGLGARKGHYNVPFLLKEKMMKKIGDWMNWYDGLGRIRNLDAFKLIDKKMSQLSNLLFTTWDKPEGLKKAQEEMQSLPLEIDKIQVEFVTKDFPSLLQKEYLDLMYVFYKNGDFSFGSLFDRPTILDSIDREMDFERIAIENTKDVAQYLKKLSAQRTSYVNSPSNISKILENLEKSVDEHKQQKDRELLEKMIKAIENFKNAVWLFRP